MILISLLGTAVASLLLVASLSDLISLARVVLGRGSARPAQRPDGTPRLLFLVPAHDEELLITSCVHSFLQQEYPAAALAMFVIADNCTDRTAALARAAGATCLERYDLSHPGKPQAIAWALRRLPIADFDGVVIVDADVVLDAGFAAGIAEAAPVRAKVVQAYNDVRNPHDSALTRMAAVLSAANHGFAFALKTRAGVNVPLGAGMSIGTDVLQKYGWQVFTIGEDWELYALLTEQGVHTESAPRARIYAEEARSLRQSQSQRHRWTAGKLTVLFRYGRRLLHSRSVDAYRKLDAIAELLATGPAVHLGVVVALATALLVSNAPGAPWVVGALLASLLRPTTYALLALVQDPEPWRAALAFSYLPIYTVWRLGVQATALTMLGDKPWVRTERNQLRQASGKP